MRKNYLYMKEKLITTQIQIATYEELTAEEKKLIDAAKNATKNSYAPYSKFNVGAAILLDNGEIITGNNQENAAYPSGLCAERVTMFYANSRYPNNAPKALAIASYANNNFLADPITPCGACRQSLLETEVRFKNNIKVYLYGTKHIYIIESIKALLPLSFDNSSLT